MSETTMGRLLTAIDNAMELGMADQAAILQDEFDEALCLLFEGRLDSSYEGEGR